LEVRRLFGVNFNNLTMQEAINLIEKQIDFNKNNSGRSVLVTPNVDHLVNLSKNTDFYSKYQKASITLVDGAPIYIASKILKKPLKEKVSGADLVPEVLKLAEKRTFKVFIFGSNDGVPELAIKKLRNENNYTFKMGYYSPPFGFDKDLNAIELGVKKINEFSPDILLVSLGSPKGELFIFDNLYRLNVPISMQVGAAIDFLAGTIKRAPLWMQKFGLEWFYRFLQEPKRMFRRYFINDAYFLTLLLKELLKKDDN
jgi:N-acetylglucosaminyldiphosphoundecaprenol N-acetyl-beta-D-mannosaminyltransferase